MTHTANFFPQDGDRAPDIQAAIDSGSETLIFAPGRYQLHDTISISDKKGFRLEGAGKWRTVFEWRGNDLKPAFLMSDCRESYLGRFTLSSTNASPLQTGIETTNGAGNEEAPRRNTFFQIDVQGTNAGGLGVAFLTSLGAGGDSLNDGNFYQQCAAQNYSEAGWKFEHSQSKLHRLLMCECASGANGDYGVYCVDGSFHWTGGSLSNNLKADFRVDSPTDTVTIEQLQSENARRFLELGQGGNKSPYAINVYGNRWSSGELTPDGYMIKSNFSGALNFVGNKVGEGQNPVPQIFLAKYPVSVNISSNSFAAWGSRDVNPLVLAPGANFTNGCDIRVQNNNFVNSIGESAAVNTFAEGDTSPSVRFGALTYRAANAAMTTIDNFEDGYPGQVIHVVFDTDETTVNFGNGLLYGNGGTPWVAQTYDVLTAVCTGPNWRCITG